MNTIGLEYGKWITPMEWTHIATIRRHYPLTELNAPKLMNKAITYGNIERLFYSIEPDMNDKHTHAHLLLYSRAKLDRDKLAKAMNMEPQSISYFEPVINQEAVSNYCTKFIGSKAIYHDLLL